MHSSNHFSNMYLCANDYIGIVHTTIKNKYNGIVVKKQHECILF